MSLDGGLKFTRAAAVMLLIGAASLCASASDESYELTGTVIDANSGKPIEGAYVLVVYKNGGGSFGGHSSSWCVGSRGMVTKADGKYRFPVAYPGASFVDPPTAIKADYQFIQYDWLNASKQQTDRKLWFTDQNVKLAPQDVTKPNLHFQREFSCARAASKQDTAAFSEFLRIEFAEFEEYGRSASELNGLWQAIKDTKVPFNLDAPYPPTPQNLAARKVEMEDREYELRVAEAQKKRKDAEASLGFVNAGNFGYSTEARDAKGKLLPTPQSLELNCAEFGPAELNEKFASRMKKAGLLVPVKPNSWHTKVPNGSCVRSTDWPLAFEFITELRNDYLDQFPTRFRRYPLRPGSSKNDVQRQAFTRAIIENDTAVVKNVLKAGLDPNSPIDPQVRDLPRVAPILVAATMGRAEIVKLLVAAGANVNSTTDTGNLIANTPLMVNANTFGKVNAPARLEIAAALLNAHADPNCRPQVADCPFISAVRHAEVEIVRLLIKAGADVNLRYGQPLKDAMYTYHSAGSNYDRARAARYLEIAEMLVEAGAILDIRQLQAYHDKDLEEALLRKAKAQK